MLSDENIEDWVTFYNLRKKLRCHPELLHTLASPLVSFNSSKAQSDFMDPHCLQETRSIFYAYVGGVYSESGHDVVNSWIKQLVELQSLLPADPMVRQPNESPPQKKMKGEPESPSRIFFGSQPPPSPPQTSAPVPTPFGMNFAMRSTAPAPMSFGRSTPLVRQMPPHMAPPLSTPYMAPPLPTLHMASPLPNPLAPAQPGAAFLPLFNQTAAQRRVSVDYPAEFSGPSHAGRWTAHCVGG